MSQPAQITAESDWARLLLALEDTTRATTQTYLDIVEFHRTERPMRGQPDRHADVEGQPSHAPRDAEDRDTQPDDRDDSRTVEEQDHQRIREEEEQLQAQQDELDLDR
jgi:hypothetical protein